MGHQTASLCVLWLALTLTSAVDVISGRNHNHGHYVCSTWGNYHFKTFDGDFYQFPGSCSYNLASHCGDSYQEFSVHVHRSMDSGHPLMDKITITIKDDVIIQLKNNLVLVNGAIARTPYYSFGILIHKTEDYFKVYTKTGLTLMWNKEDAVMLELDPKFNNHTCGLCGDYNGVHLYNEFFSGDNILKPIQFGNLQNIQDPNDKCTDPDETQEADTTHCSQYRSVCEEHLGYSAFTDCQSLLNLGNYIQACMLDMCSCDQSQDSFCLCSTITEYSRQCSHAGGRPGNWRSANFCPKQCPANMIYQESASPCKNSCSHLETLSLCEEHYMDGCFCLEGSVEDDYTDRGCVEVSECHCKHRGKLYAPGETMQNDCNECRCESGRWTCTDRACPGVCSIEGGAHFTTFDGKAYTFHGNCYYVLSKDQTNESHTILGEFSPCSSSDRDTCIKSVILLTDNLNNEVTFKADGTVLLNKLEVTLPHVTASFSILQPTDSYIIVQATFGLQMQIQRSPKMQLYITMEKSESRQLLGLCGDFNSKEGDDFKTSGGLVEATASAFANTWKAQPSCQDMSDWLDNPCSLSIENKRYANTWCSKLEKSEPFVKCHTTIDPTEYAKRCRYDSCSCKDSEVCICAALSSYVRACAAKGIILWGWRNHICDKDIASCPSSQVYLYNLTTCQPTCRSLAEGAKACSSVFTPVDGCGCPDREYLNEKHQCVPISKCSCYFDGTYLNPQDAIYKQDDRYICINGKLVCTNHGNETCPEGKVYFDCNKVQSDISGVPVQRSCKTLSIQYFQTKCISGCVCPDGLLDDGAGGCVPEDKCPCVHNEDVFPHGTQIPVDCNACLCQRGRWTCTDAVCYGTCTIYGNGHYITFDEKMYDFDGNCEFVAVHDYCGPKHSDGSFSIITENIPCGTTGVTCSKSIKVFLGSTVLKLAEKHIEEIETEGKKQVTYLIREVGIYLVIEASNNILLIWDRKTTIFIKVSPEYKDKLCGLCGNFDDNSQNEFKTRNILQVTDVLEFGNSWKVDSTCPDAKAVVNPCSQRPHRHSWAEKQCSLILSHVFKVCHSKVDPKPFYEACVNDACSCDSGGDCECFCTAVAAYAQECTKAEACVYWRTPDICPLFCDYYNPEDECEWHYYPCGNHSVETCRSINNVYTNVTITYLEGCYPTCPEDKPIFDELKKICVTKEECGCYINNAHYEIGEEVPRYKNCHKCVCSSKGKVECRITEDGELSRVQQSGLCIVVTCVNGKENLDINICSSTTPITTSTTSVTTIMPLAITVTTTTQLTSTIQHSSTTCVYEKVCQWSQWFDVSKPAEDLDSGDYEIYDEIRKKHPFCNVPDQIECRAANAHDVSLKELKQTVHCNVSYGLICRNSEQKPDKNLWQKCFNYEIRVDCCDYECIHSTPITTTPSTTTPTTTTPTTKTPIVISTITTTPTTTTPIVTSTFTITPTTTTPIVTSTFTTTPTNTTPIATTTFTTTPIVTSTFTTNPTTITPSTTNPIVTSTFTTTPTTTTLSTTTPIVTSTFTTTPTITTPSSTTPIGTSTFTTTPTTTTLSTTTPIVTSTFTTTPATTTPSTTTPIVTSTFTTTPTTTTPIATSTFTTTPTTTTPIVNSTFTTTPTTTTPSTTTPTTTTPTTTTPIVISTFTTTPTTTTPIVTSTITTTPTTTTPIVTSTFTTTPTNTTPIATTTFTTTPTTTTPIVTSTFTTNPTTITPSTTTPIVTSTFTTTPTTTTLSTTTPIVTSTFTTTPTITTPSSTTPIGTSTFTTTPTTTTLSTTTPIVTSTFTTTPATTTPSTTTPIVTSTFTTTPTTTTPIATSTFTTTPTTTTPIVNSTFTTTPTTTTPSTTTPIVTITFTTTPSTTTPIVTSTFTTTPTTTTSSTTTPIVTSTFATTPEITTRPLETTATTAPSSPTFTTTEIMTAPSCVPECSWSEWYNVMYPEYGDDGGDYETYEDIRKAGHHVCEKPENISCRAPDFSDTPLEESGQKVTCNVSYGLICNNKDQDELLPICHNYEISVYCCSPLPDYCLTTPPEITTITIQSSTITPGTIITETRITPHITATPETTAPTTTESTTATTPGTPTTSKPPDTATPKTITTNTETTTTTFPTKTFGINIETPKATTLTTKVSRQEFNTSSVTTTGLLNTTTPKASSTIPTMSETLPTTSSVSTAPLSTPTPETDILFSTMCICMFDGKTYLPGEIISGVANETWCYKVICNSECKSQVSYWLCSTSPPSKTTKFTTTQASSQTSTRSTGTSTETITTEKTTTHITPKVLPTTQKPGCFLQPFRQYNETWMLYNCTMARCLDNNQIEITELQCEPPAKITCANRHPPKAVQNADRCCWHWECDCVCSGWGDPHYVTFDGTYYSYQGNCTYVLVEEIEKRIDNFSIYIDNYDCGTKDRVSCPRNLIVQYKTQEIQLPYQNKHIQATANEQPIGIPFEKYGLKVYKSGIYHIVEIQELRAIIRYNGMDFAIQLPYSLFGHNTQGQCGTCTNNRADDCRTRSGEIASNCEIMADSWIVTGKPECSRVKPTVPPKTTVPSNDCQLSPLCNLIRGQPFKKCHKILPPDNYYQACVYDSCHVPNANIGCSSLQHYAQLCGDQGICIEWREKAPECPLTCPSHKVYNACGPTMPTTCKTNLEEDALIKDDKRLVEGCFCPQDTMRFSPDVDVCVQKCGCVGPDNIPRKLGERFQLSCQDCICMEGGSGITCKKQKCKDMEDVVCGLEGFYPETQINPSDPCCSETVCKCNPSRCSNKSPNCGLGYKAIAYIPMGHCCSLYKCVPKNVCVHRNAEYMPGAPVFSDNCQNCVCSEKANSTTGVEITCTDVPCIVRCPLGFTLKQRPEDCCGVCEQTHCVLSQNGHYQLMKPGEVIWSEKENCTIHNCTVIKDQFITSVFKISCPPFNEEDCEPGTIQLLPDGCCKTCNEKTMPCKLQTYNEYLFHENCRSEHTVKLSRCKGSCETSSIYSAAARIMTHSCTCCQEVQTSQKNITLKCGEKSEVDYEYIYVEKCECVNTHCGPVKSAEEQTPARTRRSGKLNKRRSLR